MTAASQLLDRLLAAYASERRLVLLFDYDGTLAPLAAHPRFAQLSRRMRRLLEQLALCPRLAIGVLSGRMIGDLKAMVRIPDICYSGTSGLELDLCGSSLVHPRAEDGRALVDQAAVPVCDLAARFPGAWVEQKPFGLTLHYRAVADAQVADLCRRVRQLFRPCSDHWRILDGPRSIEATLALGWTKGSAVRMIVEHAGGSAWPCYVGDDANDEDALEEATLLGGLAVGIGPRAPQAAQCRLAKPADLENLLARFVRALGLLDRSEWQQRREPARAE